MFGGVKMNPLLLIQDMLKDIMERVVLLEDKVKSLEEYQKREKLK